MSETSSTVLQTCQCAQKLFITTGFLLLGESASGVYAVQVFKLKWVFFKISLRLVSISIHYLMVLVGWISVKKDFMTRITCLSESRDNLVSSRVSSSQAPF